MVGTGRFRSFGDGLAWFTDPAEWTAVAGAQLPLCTVLSPRLDPALLTGPYHPWLRTAFGEMRCWSPTHGVAIAIDPMYHWITGADYSRDVANGLPTLPVEPTILARPKQFDVIDGKKKPLFKRLRRRYGTLRADTYYGLTLPVALGGRVELDNFGITPVRGHLLPDDEG
nr:T6SS immunity protein Tdi1 domain-containing protein [Nakamurella aerolata]